jgi:hypothetical protein
MNGKTNSNPSAIVAIAVAIIGCVGLMGAALIQVLPDLLKSDQTSVTENPIIVPSNTLEIGVAIVPTTTIASTIQSSHAVTPVGTNCPSPSSYAIDVQSLKPGMSISGPATIHPYDGGAELARTLGLGWVSRWGVNVQSGITVQIPQTITSLSGNQYTPDGYVDIYLDDARMDAAQQCWLLNNP